MVFWDKFKFRQKPLSAEIKKSAASGGSLYSEQAVNKMNKFFDNLIKTDTDAVLSAVGVSRSQLEVLLFDDEIDGKIDRRTENLTQSKYVLSDGDSKVSEFIYEQLDRHLEGLLKSCLRAKLFGYCVSEVTWSSTEMAKVHKTFIGDDIANEEQYNNLDKWKYQYNNRSITREQYEKLFWVGERYADRVTEKPIEWFEPLRNGVLLWYPKDEFRAVAVDTKYRYMLMQHDPTYKEPKGKALLSRVYWLWYFKKNGWQFWSKNLERFGSPLLVGTTEGDPQALADALLAAHNQSVVAINEGDSVTPISSNSNGEAFKAYDDAINKRIAIYILGQTLTSGTDTGGTYGQGLVHQDQQEIIFDSDKKFATKYVQEFINRVCLLNGYEPPTFNFTFEKGLQPERAERDSKLYSQGVRFDESYYIDAYDFKPEYIKVVEDSAATVMQLSSKPVRALQFAQDDDSEFTDEQQELEQVADNALNASIQPFDVNKVLTAIELATDADSLTSALFDMVGDSLAQSEFTQLVNTALQVADVHGFADESSEV